MKKNTIQKIQNSFSNCKKYLLPIVILSTLSGCATTDDLIGKLGFKVRNHVYNNPNAANNEFESQYNKLVRRTPEENQKMIAASALTENNRNQIKTIYEYTPPADNSIKLEEVIVKDLPFEQKPKSEHKKIHKSTKKTTKKKNKHTNKVNNKKNIEKEININQVVIPNTPSKLENLSNPNITNTQNNKVEQNINHVPFPNVENNKQNQNNNIIPVMPPINNNISKKEQSNSTLSNNQQKQAPQLTPTAQNIETNIKPVEIENPNKSIPLPVIEEIPNNKDNKKTESTPPLPNLSQNDDKDFDISDFQIINQKEFHN